MLYEWDADFANTSTITTSVVMLVLPGHGHMYMDSWHYIDLSYYTNGSAWGWMTWPSRTSLFQCLRRSSFTTTQSKWDANFALRNLIHVVGDVHQPLHVVVAVNADNTGDDDGGNY